MALGTDGLRPTRAGAERGAGLATPVLLALIWLFGASACLLLYLGSRLTFLLDDWTFLLYRRGFDADAVLGPHGEHIVVAPVLIYKALLATVGMGSALPYRVVSTALFLLSAALLFVYLRRRVGDWPALAATAIVLFLGAAWEDLLWSFQMTYFGSVAAGLGALLALDREDRRGEALACLLLVVSVLFASLGISFALGAAVHVLLQPQRRRRLYVFLVPLAVYVLWWLGWGHEAESALSIANMAKTPLFVLDSVAAALASLFGLATPGAGTGAGGLDWGRPLAVAAILLGLWRAYRRERISSWLWVVLAIGGSFWILAGFNQIPGRDPISSRYQYVGVVFVLLIGAELLRGVRLDWRTSPGTLAAVLMVAVASIGSNVYYLSEAFSDGYHPISRLEKASLGALEIARDTVEPGFLLTEEVAGTGYVHVDAGSYLSARDEFGSPAYDPAELAEASSEARFAADKVLFGALRMGLAPLAADAVPALPRQRLTGDPAGAAVKAGTCLVVPSDGGETPLLTLPRAGAMIEAGGTPVEKVKLARFSSGTFPIELAEPIGPHQAAQLAIPPDRARQPWKLQLETASEATVCGIGSA